MLLVDMNEKYYLCYNCIELHKSLICNQSSTIIYLLLLHEKIKDPTKIKKNYMLL